MTDIEDQDVIDCDPNDPDCEQLPKAKQFAAAHFFLWLFTVLNGGAPIIYWFFFFKKEIDADAVSKPILYRNWWWMETAWPMIIWGHVGLYGFAAFWGLFTWFGVKFFDVVYSFWMTAMVNYIGTIMAFAACLSFLAGAGFWVPNDLVSITRAWITSGAYVGWTVLGFFWMGLTVEKSKTYMYLRHCKDDCYVEVEAEEDEAEEIADDATTFHFDMFNF